MDTGPAVTLRDLSDEELLIRLRDLVTRSRRVEADLVEHIGEVDERRLFARQAFPSMFAYCTEGLHLSEAEAYRRITVARAARSHPALLAALRNGELHLSGIALLAPLLTAANCAQVLERARHLSKRRLEELVAEIAPRPDAPTIVRALRGGEVGNGQAAPERRTADAAVPLELVPGRVEIPAAERERPSGGAGRPVPAAARTGSIEPLSPARYKVQFTASAELREKLDRLAALMRTDVQGNLAAVVDRAVSETLARLETRRFGAKVAAGSTATPRRKAARRSKVAPQATVAPRATVARLAPVVTSLTVPSSRHIPAAVRRAVRQRDGERCHFTDERGRRCTESRRLEFHHRHPFGLGGDHSPGNVTLLCATHNRHLAELDYGRRAPQRKRLERAARPPIEGARRGVANDTRDPGRRLPSVGGPPTALGASSCSHEPLESAPTTGAQGTSREQEVTGHEPVAASQQPRASSREPAAAGREPSGTSHHPSAGWRGAP